MASLTLATTALGSTALAQDGAAPDLTTSTYGERFKNAPEARRKGTVIFADWQEANLFNPYYYNQVTEANVTTATQGGLITSTDDYKYAPDFAVSIPQVSNGGVVVNADGTVTITWELRPGLKWSDGEPLTCADYKFTNDWILQPDNVGMPAGKTGYLTDAGLAHYGETGEVAPEDINLSIDCQSDTTMVWTLQEAYEGYLVLIPVPLPEHFMKDIPIVDALTGAGYLADQLPTTPVSGPFKYESVTPGQQLVLVRNDNYADHMTGKPAFLDKLIFRWYGDADAMIAAYQGDNPEYDVATDLNDADIPKLGGLKRVLAMPSLTYEFLRPNWDDSHCSLTLQPVRAGNCVMSDAAMREALKLSLDKDAINQRLLGGNAAIAYTNTSPNAWYYVAPAQIPTQDLDAASAALAEAGWVVDPASGFLFKNVNGDFTCDQDPDATVQTTGDPAEVCAAFPAAEDGSFPSSPVKNYEDGDYDARVEACTTTRQVRQDTLAMVSGFMNALGVQVLISPVSAADIFASYNESTLQTPCALSRGNYDLAEHAFSVPLDPQSNYPVYHSSQFQPNGQNDAKVNDPDLDAALDAVKTTVDFTVVRDAMATFQRIYVDKTIEVPLYYRQEVYLVNPKLRNFTGNPTSTGPTWNAQHWWLAK
jgi:ABC-type transport system substrate-binding protein